MNIQRQFQSLRDTAFRLSLAGGEVRHVESGFRGQIIVSGDEPSSPQDQQEELTFLPPLTDDACREFTRRLLGLNSPSLHVGEEPWRTFGFAFSAADSGCSLPTVEQEESLEGIGHSLVYGDELSMQQLAELVAVPALKYLANASPHGCPRQDSWAVPGAALGDWVYVIYEVGLKTGDPNLRRYYRFITPFEAPTVGEDSDILFGFDGCTIQESDLPQCELWQPLWGAAKRKELAFARLGTELTLASRIALDHLLDMDAEEAGQEIFEKFRRRVVSRLNDTERFTLLAAAEHTSPESRLSTGDIATVSGNPENSNFKQTLSRLVKMGLLENEGRGYFMPSESRWILDHIKH